MLARWPLSGFEFFFAAGKTDGLRGRTIRTCCRDAMENRDEAAARNNLQIQWQSCAVMHTETTPVCLTRCEQPKASNAEVKSNGHVRLALGVSYPDQDLRVTVLAVRNAHLDLHHAWDCSLFDGDRGDRQIETVDRDERC